MCIAGNLIVKKRKSARGRDGRAWGLRASAAIEVFYYQSMTYILICGRAQAPVTCLAGQTQAPDNG